MPLTEQDKEKLDKLLAKVSTMFYSLEARLRKAEMEHFNNLIEAKTVTLTHTGQIKTEN